MSEGTADRSESAATGGNEAKKSRFGAEELVLVVLVVLSLTGIAVANLSRSYGLWYWLAMVPVFAVASLAAGWTGARGDEPGRLGRVARQLLHWSALGLLVYLIHWLELAGRISNKDAGLIALLAFALTTFLAGIHFDWRLMVVGAVLGVAATAAVVVEEFLWALVIPAAVVGVGVLIWRRRSSGKSAAEPAPGPG
jgi:hypothetical protein